MFIRSKHNPILKPDPKNKWESRKVYNPGVIYENGRYHLFYRAVGEDWRSSIGYAVSDDGVNLKRFAQPVIAPEYAREKRGVEDPRISKIGRRYFLTYTGYGGNGTAAQLCLASSKNFKKWTKLGVALKKWNLKKAGGFLVKWDPAQVEAEKSGTGERWSKAGGVFPEKIKNNYWMLFGDRNIWLAASKSGKEWKSILKPVIKPRRGNYFDNKHVEMGPPPIKTRHGWLVLYHGINDKIIYRLGYLLLDLRDPRKILKRSAKPIFEPAAGYELKGLADIAKGRRPKIIFCNGAVLFGDTLRIYYGAGDSVVCTASAKLTDVLNRK